MIYLFYLDLFWAGAALVYDFPKLLSIPYYLWPIVVICPLFPLLLAATFYQITKNKKPNQLLLAFAAIPSFVYGGLALVYYPSLMVNEGFNWYGIGQMLWVVFYGTQGLYLIYRYKIKTYAVLVACIYLLPKLYIEYKYLSFGYLTLSKLSPLQLNIIFAFAVIVTVFVASYLISKGDN